MSIDRVREELWQAIEILVSAGPIQKRLGYVAAEILLRLNPGEIPVEQRADFVEIIDALKGQGSVHDHADTLSDQDAAKLARQISSIYIAIRGGI